MKKRILSTVIALIIALPTFASVAVAPTKLEINSTRFKTNYVTSALEIKGNDKTPTRYRAFAEYFKVNEKGELVMIEKSDEPQNIAKKLRFIPSEFTVAQGKNQKLRVNIPNLNTLVDGESRAVLYIEDVNPKEYMLDTGRPGIGAQLIIKTRVAVPIYVDHGKAVRNAEIEYAKINKQKDGYYLEMKVTDSGNSKARCNGMIQISEAKKLKTETKLQEFVVAPGSYNIVKTKINTDKLEPGTYSARVVVTYRDINEKMKTLKQEIELNL
ncbi:MAG: hypothetical protein MJ230_02775 [bacterium]|nr:hypothetical protein [bacterium]